MRDPVSRQRLERLLDELDRHATGPGRVYLCGGATALLVGWRDSTIDVDIQFDPEPEGIFEAIRKLKNEMRLNIEVAGPADFVPALPGWRSRCIHIASKRRIEFLHYDPYTQALSKIARGHDKDLSDVTAMVAAKLIEPAQLQAFFEQCKPALIRYPRLDAADLARRVEAWVDDASVGE